MSPSILLSSQARCDLVEVSDYLEQTAGLTTAERFLDALQRALDSLAVMPLMGSTWESSQPRLSGVRTWPVPGFLKYLIFYRPFPDGIEVLRVLHGARDTAAILEGGFN